MPTDARPESDHCPHGVIVWAEGPVRAPLMLDDRDEKSVLLLGDVVTVFDDYEEAQEAIDRTRAWARDQGLDWAERDHHIQPLAPVEYSGEMQNRLDDAHHEARDDE